MFPNSSQSYQISDNEKIIGSIIHNFPIKFQVFRNKTLCTPNLDNFTPSSDFSLDITIFNNFLKLLLMKIAKASNIYKYFNSSFCLNLQKSSSLNDYSLSINFVEWKVFIPKVMALSVSKCLAESVRYVILPIHLEFNKSGHSNVVIIDTFDKTIELFEPHGFQMYHHYNNFVNIVNIIFSYIKILFPQLSTFTLHNASTFCLSGPQTIQGGKQGHCLAWSLYYITLRILNVDVVKQTHDAQYKHLHISNFINQTLTTLSSTELNETIRKFINFAKFQILINETELSQLNTLNTVNTHIGYNIEHIAKREIFTNLSFMLTKVFTANKTVLWSFLEKIKFFADLYYGTYSVVSDFFNHLISHPLLYLKPYIAQSELDIELLLAYTEPFLLDYVTSQARQFVDFFPFQNNELFKTELTLILHYKNLDTLDYFPNVLRSVILEKIKLLHLI